MSKIFPAIMIIWLLICGSFFLVIHPAQAQVQSQETVNAQNSYILNTISKDIDKLEAQNLDRRITLLEDTIFEVKWFGRTAAVALIGQFYMMLMERRKVRSTDSQEV